MFGIKERFKKLEVLEVQVTCLTNRLNCSEGKHEWVLGGNHWADTYTILFGGRKADPVTFCKHCSVRLKDVQVQTAEKSDEKKPKRKQSRSASGKKRKA